MTNRTKPRRPTPKSQCIQPPCYPPQAAPTRVDYRMGRGGFGRAKSCRLIDLCESQAIVATCKPFKPGTPIVLGFHNLVRSIHHQCRGVAIECERESEYADSEYLVLCQFDWPLPHALFRSLTR